MDPKLKQQFIQLTENIRLKKYGLYIIIFSLVWFLSRWHFREFSTVGSLNEEIITPDEMYWVLQSIHFRQALIERDWHGLVRSAHPGFITMWLGSVGTTLRLWFQPELQSEINWLLQQEWVLPQTGELSQRLHPFLEPSRNTLRYLVAALWLLIAHLANRRVRRTSIVLITMILLVTDMWLLGLTSIFHVDGLLALFSLATLLLVLPRSDIEIGWYSKRRYLLTGCMMAGAILSKVPGLLLLAVVPLVLLAQQILRMRANKSSGFSELLLNLGWVFLGLVGSIGIVAPIVFIDPAHVYENVVALSSREVGFQANTFFLGRITPNPGPLFYPLTIFFRQQIFVSIGLVLAVASPFLTKENSQQRLFYTTLIGFSILFWAGLLISDRVFARYAIPIFLILSFIGALEIAKFISNLKLRTKRPHLPIFQPRPIFGFIVAGIILLRIIIQVDPFVFTNQLVGGYFVGPRLMLTGWGGEHSIAASFNQQSPVPNRTIFTDNIPSTAPFINLELNSVYLLNEQTAWLIKPTDLVFLSLENQQLNPERWEADLEDHSTNSSILSRIPTNQKPIHSIYSAGVPRVSVYTGFQDDILNSGLTRFENDGLAFGQGLLLKESTVIKPHDEFNVYLLLRWRHDKPSDGTLKFTIVDKDENIWVTNEEPLVDFENRPSSIWSKGLEHLSIHRLPLASDMPPETYQIQMSLFGENGDLLGATDQQSNFLGTAAQLADLQVHVPSPQPPVEIIKGGDAYRNEQIHAVSPPPQSIGQGETLRADVWIRHLQMDEAKRSLLLTIGNEIIEYPFLTDDWQDNFLYRVRPNWRIPDELEPGTYAASLNDISLGDITIERRERNFELPSNIISRGIMVGEIGEIIDFSLNKETGETTLIWQAHKPDKTNYSLFIHLLDVDKNIIDQADLVPGKPTSQTIANEVMTVTTAFALESVDKAHFIVTGFYNPATGQRQPLVRQSDGSVIQSRQLQINLTPNEN